MLGADMAPAFSVPLAQHTPPPPGNLPAGYGSLPLFLPPDFPIRIHPPQNPYNKKSTACAFAWEKTRSLATLPEKNKTVAYRFGEKHTNFPPSGSTLSCRQNQKKCVPRFRGAGESQRSDIALDSSFGVWETCPWKRLYIWVTARTMDRLIRFLWLRGKGRGKEFARREMPSKPPLHSDLELRPDWTSTIR